MRQLLVYERATGRPLHTLTCGADVADAVAAAQVTDAHGVLGVTGADLPGADLSGGGVWIDGEAPGGPALRRRAPMPASLDRAALAADGLDRVRLAVPPGAVVAVGGETIPVPGGVLSWGTDLPGRYELRVSAWPYLDAVFALLAEPGASGAAPRDPSGAASRDPSGAAATDHVHRATRDRVAAARRNAYLSAWPEDQQREAVIEAAMGRPGKLAALTADFARIRAALPYPVPAGPSPTAAAGGG